MYIQSCLVYPYTLVHTCFGWINEVCGLLNHPITIGNYICVFGCCVCIFPGRCWIVYVHKREYYIKIKKNKEIGLKQFINWCNIKGILHTRWRFAGGRGIANISEEMNLRLLLTCAMLRSLLNLINLNACFVLFNCNQFFSVTTTNMLNDLSYKVLRKHSHDHRMMYVKVLV